MQLPGLNDWFEDISCAALRASLFFSFHQAIPKELHDKDIIKNQIVATASRLKQEPAKYLSVNNDEMGEQGRRFGQEVFVVGELFKVCHVAGIRSRGK